MARQACLTANNNIITDMRASSYTDESNYEAVFTNDDIVAYLDQIINLCSLSNSGFCKTSAIDCSIGSQVNFIL